MTELLRMATVVDTNAESLGGAQHALLFVLLPHTTFPLVGQIGDEAKVWAEIEALLARRKARLASPQSGGVCRTSTT